MKMMYVAKTLMLVIVLLLVLVFRNYAGSRSFTQTLSAMFYTPPPKNTLNWCTDHVVDVTWLSDEISAGLKKLSSADLRDDFCQLQTEAIIDIDLDKVKWRPLAESSGATAQKTLLEWSAEQGLFRTGGMPFKSSGLTKVLQK